MTTFDDREKGFEKKFALDQDLKFKAEARRNNMMAAWAAEKLGITGDDVQEYAKTVRRADLEEAGDDDVFRKIRADFDKKNVSATDDEIRSALVEFMAKAIADIEQKS